MPDTKQIIFLIKLPAIRPSYIFEANIQRKNIKEKVIDRVLGYESLHSCHITRRPLLQHCARPPPISFAASLWYSPDRIAGRTCGSREKMFYPASLGGVVAADATPLPPFMAPLGLRERARSKRYESSKATFPHLLSNVGTAYSF